MFGKSNARRLVVVLGFIFVFMPNALSAQTTDIPPNWYCDERWQNSDSIYLGTVTEIVSFQDAEPSVKFSEKSFSVADVEYKIKNIIRFNVEKNYRDANDKNDQQQEIIIYNTQTTNRPAFDFKRGEKYLVYLKSHGYGESRGKGTFSNYLNYAVPDGKTKRAAEADDTIAFLEKVYRLDSTEEILGYKGRDFITGGIVGGKATNLVKPAYPKDAKKEKASGSVNVMVLVDEQGQVIKAKAVCAVYPSLAGAAEAAALQSKFSPTLVSGRSIKVKGVIVYNFVP